MAERKQILQRLKRLFSTNVIVRNVGGKKLKVIDTNSAQIYANRAYKDRWSRLHRGFRGMQNAKELGIAYQSIRLELFRDYDAMDADPILSCLHKDTRVSTLEGFFTMEQLAEKYPNGESFEVWSWDRDECKYTMGNAHHVRKTGTKNVIKLVLDNGNFLECTPDHRIMIIDGTYKQAGELKPGDSVMPFYYMNKRYMMVSNCRGKYKKAHRYIYEDILNKDISGRHIHHINHNRYDNRTSNLEDMSPDEHMEYHGISKITCDKKSNSWTEEKKQAARDRMIEKMKDPEYKRKAMAGFERHRARHDYKELQSKYTKDNWASYDEDKKRLVMSGFTNWQNSIEGKEFMSNHASKLNKDRWANDVEYRVKMSKIFSNHAKLMWADPEWKDYKRKLHSQTMKLKYANDPTLRDRTKRCGDTNGRFVSDITNEFLLIEGIKYTNLTDFAKNIKLPTNFKKLQYKKQFIRRRLQAIGYDSFEEYKEKYLYQNHKIVEVIDTGNVVDVYDLTVDFFENFCLECGIVVSNSALDIYSDESTTKNEFGDILTINTNNSDIKDILHNLYYDILNIEFSLWPWIRNMCKYGDFFLYLDIHEDYGIHNVVPISVYDIQRIEGFDPENPHMVKFSTESSLFDKKEFENYEIAHFRLLSDSNFLPYGKGMLENARRVWKQITLMEDAMLIHRIMRAPERRVFKIDIGNIAPAEVDLYMEKIINKMKKIPFIDANTGDYNLKFNIQNLTEDFYLPVRGSDTGTQIDNLPGLDWTSIEDIEYLQNKLFAALKIPKAFLGFDENVEGKATLAAEDVRFARTIERIQRIIVSELTNIGIAHLAVQGYEDEDLVNFNLELTNPSTIYEQEKVNLWSEKISLASSIVDTKLLSTDWIYDNIFNISEDQIETQREGVAMDHKLRFRYAQIEEGNDPADSGKKAGEGEDGEESDMGNDENLNEIDYDDEVFKKGGRPKEPGNRDSDENAFGRDPLGKKINRKKVAGTADRDRSHNPKRIESTGDFASGIGEFLHRKKLLQEKLDKKRLADKKAEEAKNNSGKTDFMDESNIIE